MLCVPMQGTAAAFPSFLFLAAPCGCPMVMRMMKKIAVLCVAASASLLWCGCDRKPAAGEKQAAPAPGNGKSLPKKRGRPQPGGNAWTPPPAKAAREKGNDREHVKTSMTWPPCMRRDCRTAGPIRWMCAPGVTPWRKRVPDITGRRLSAPCSCTRPASSVMPERPGVV